MGVNRLSTTGSLGVVESTNRVKKIPYNPVEIFVGRPESLDLLDGVDHRGVMFSSETPPDLRQAGTGEFLAQVHRDLPGKRNGF